MLTRKPRSLNLERLTGRPDVPPALDEGRGMRGDSFYPGPMNTIHLTDAELQMARNGMAAYLQVFGHDEADTVVLIKAVIAKLAAAQQEASLD